MCDGNARQAGRRWRLRRPRRGRRRGARSPFALFSLLLLLLLILQRLHAPEEDLLAALEIDVGRHDVVVVVLLPPPTTTTTLAPCVGCDPLPVVGASRDEEKPRLVCALTHTTSHTRTHPHQLLPRARINSCHDPRASSRGWSRAPRRAGETSGRPDRSLSPRHAPVADQTTVFSSHRGTVAPHPLTRSPFCFSLPQNPLNNRTAAAGAPSTSAAPLCCAAAATAHLPSPLLPPPGSPTRRRPEDGVVGLSSSLDWARSYAAKAARGGGKKGGGGGGGGKKGKGRGGNQHDDEDEAKEDDEDDDEGGAGDDDDDDLVKMDEIER